MAKAAIPVISKEVSEAVSKELLPELVEACRGILRMLRMLSESVSAGLTPPDSVAGLFESLAWHLDRIILLVASGTGESVEGYEELISKARELRRVK